MESIRLVCRCLEEVGSFKVRSHILPTGDSEHDRIHCERSIVETLSHCVKKRARRVIRRCVSTVCVREWAREREREGEREGEREKDERQYVEVVHHRVRIYLFIIERHLIERSCRHHCTGDKPTFFCRIMKRDSRSRRTRCQMRLSYLIARCAKWCHRHTCARRVTERRLNDHVRPYDKELIRYRGRSLVGGSALYWPNSRKQHPTAKIPGSDKRVWKLRVVMRDSMIIVIIIAIVVRKEMIIIYFHYSCVIDGEFIRSAC
jgi:hypothetical protein